MRDTQQKLTWQTVLLHWVIAIAMISMLAFGLYIEGMAKGPDKWAFISLHKSIGVLIFVFAAYRIYWRYLNKFPKPISELPNWQNIMSMVAHWVLIIGTVLMPISGLLMTVGGGHAVAVFGLEIIAGSDVKIELLSNIGGAAHGLGGKLILLFIVLHAAGAIKHQFLEKDGTISRMLGKRIDSND